MRSTCAVAIMMISLTAADPELLSAESSFWTGELAAARDSATKDGKPILVLVRNAWVAASLDAGHWLALASENGNLQNEVLRGLLSQYHTVVIWNTHPALKAKVFAPRSGFLFFTPKGELMGVEPVPERRDQLPSLLGEALLHPLALDEFVSAAANKPSLVERAVRLLRQGGRADHALDLVRATEGVLGAWRPHGERADVLCWEACDHASSRLRRVAETFERYRDLQKRDQRPSKEELAEAFAALNGSLTVGAERNEALKKAAAEAKTAVTALEGKDPDKPCLDKVAALISRLNARAKELKEEADGVRKTFREAHPDSTRVLFGQVAEALSERDRSPEADAKLGELVTKLLYRPFEGEDLSQPVGLLVSAVGGAGNAEQRKPLAEKIKTELGTGRVAADALLDLADQAYEEADENLAKECWKAAEKAAEGGESPTLYRAARAMRALCEGKDSPRRSRWAKREVLDVLVLVPDLPTYAAAVSKWTEKQFFPVLFTEDLYTPKFAAAFKPAEVVLVPSVMKKGDSDALSEAAIRRAILLAWKKDEKKARVPDSPDVGELQARLAELGDNPQGVVFGDSVSGETAGGLALAAGRFQGFEMLPVPKANKGHDSRIAKPDDFLSWDAALALTNQVREGLARWGLPFEDRWAAVTLAGQYPYRYNGEPYQRWGTTFAMDDLLGRAEDLTRVAVVGRLCGDSSRSAYQAMCSLFLSPKKTLLFNTYGGNPRSIWGQYGMERAEPLMREAGLGVTHVSDEKADIAGFRREALPWNAYELMIINSSGGTHSWSVQGGGNGTPDDFPIGGPCAMHVTHSGTAGDLYNPDRSLAAPSGAARSGTSARRPNPFCPPSSPRATPCRAS